MVLFITPMKTSTWLCIKLMGHVRIVGEYHRSHRWGTQKTSKPNETHSQTNIDIEVVDNIDFVFFRGVTRPGHFIFLCSGAGIKWSNQHRFGFFQECNPVRPLYRKGLRGSASADGVRWRGDTLWCTWGRTISISMCFLLALYIFGTCALPFWEHYGRRQNHLDMPFGSLEH